MKYRKLLLTFSCLIVLKHRLVSNNAFRLRLFLKQLEVAVAYIPPHHWCKHPLKLFQVVPIHPCKENVIFDFLPPS